MAAPIVLHPTATEGYGRNARFVVRDFELWRDELGRAVVDAFSARRGDSPPFCLKIDVRDVQRVLEAETEARASGQGTTLRLEHDAVARGRNGWFNVAELYFYLAGSTMELSAFSQRRGGQAPASLFLGGSDAHELLSALDRLAPV